MDLAAWRAMYAPERSTLVGSLPEKAPPPCAPQPPYVSMMILRPVRPASPCGPPITKRPAGASPQVRGGPEVDCVFDDLAPVHTRVAVWTADHEAACQLGY